MNRRFAMNRRDATGQAAGTKAPAVWGGSPPARRPKLLAALAARLCALPRPDKSALGRLAGLALLWALWLGLCLLGFGCANAVQARYPAPSLRYRQPISSGAAEDARRHAAENPDEALWPTFWAEGSLTAESDLASRTAEGIFFSGDGALVRPVTYLRGGYPGSADENGVAISSGLAWALWGSLDAVGNTVTLNGQSYTVRGVYDEAGLTALISYGEREYAPGWTAVELAGAPEGDRKAAAEAFAGAAGLGSPDALIDGPGVAALARGLASLGMLLPALSAGAMLVLQLTRGKIRREVLFYLAFAALALALPALLAALPPALVPGKWSDFSFWTTLAGNLKTGLLAFVNAGAAAKDAEVKLLLAGQLCLFFTALMAGFRLLRLHRGQ